MEREAWIIDAVRSPRGIGKKGKGSLSPLHPQRLLEEAEAVEMTPEQRSFGHAMSRRWIVGSAEQAKAQLAELATTYGVDEVMVHPVAGAAAGTDVTTSPNREETLGLLVG